MAWVYYKHHFLVVFVLSFIVLQYYFTNFEPSFSGRRMYWSLVKNHQAGQKQDKLGYFHMWSEPIMVRDVVIGAQCPKHLDHGNCRSPTCIPTVENSLVVRCKN